MGWKSSGDRWDQDKSEYEHIIKCVYGYAELTLAACEYSSFCGLNIEHGLNHERQDVETECCVKGVLHETGSLNKRHTKFSLTFDDTDGGPDHIGHVYLTHLEVHASKDKRPEEKPLELHGYISDPQRYRRKLFERTIEMAATSGLQFIHFAIAFYDRFNETPNPADPGSDAAAALLRGRGYADHRKIRSVRLWPQVRLAKSARMGS